MVYKIVDPHNYLLMTINGQLMRGWFEHERLKPAILKTDKGNVNTLLALKKSDESKNICMTYSPTSQKNLTA